MQSKILRNEAQDNLFCSCNSETEIKWALKTFFPRWNRQGQWKFVVEPFSNRYRGFTDFDKKQIHICFAESTLDIQSTVIHEVCHAIAGPGTDPHGNRWKKELERCELQASDMPSILNLWIHEANAHYYSEFESCVS